MDVMPSPNTPSPAQIFRLQFNRPPRRYYFNFNPNSNLNVDVYASEKPKVERLNQNSGQTPTITITPPTTQHSTCHSQTMQYFGN
ncbi:hypothetical protein G7K_3951-t1 [Saitoella complicata NRRL Y-17804]|uniref:Uncharacterized protein n=1 Tax=Saitoella complicata (strain BCRC 22490 / CBS 7301 / JCM 7358 / NBRC 10748 / NRRL Y-17804) TaxID=698492 RepID=A0A0E9NJ18_SAICN|nr:hypothetical protein G7K_3951-t1 [Saitoella complicata NRRL Y-17804]